MKNNYEVGEEVIVSFVGKIKKIEISGDRIFYSVEMDNTKERIGSFAGFLTEAELSRP